MSHMRQTVLSSLSAVGATHEAKFYADLFAQDDPERFALILLDPRILKNPLLEALTSNLQILANLDLVPILLIGALDDDRTSIRFQAQRLTRDLEAAGVKVAKLNTASYGLMTELRRRTQKGIIPVLEMMDRRGPMNLPRLVSELRPLKVVSLQPSGGLSLNGVRRRNLRLKDIEPLLNDAALTAGQQAFLRLVLRLEAEASTERRRYVLASPLNLLTELFTTKGSGTLIRQTVDVITREDLDDVDKGALETAINQAFAKPINSAVLNRPIYRAFYEASFRAGAILTDHEGLIYLSKFWVVPEARGDGLARDIWDAVEGHIPAFFWRSRQGNPFNDWYLGVCDGMHRTDEWRVFWKGLEPQQIQSAISAALNAPDDFTVNHAN